MGFISLTHLQTALNKIKTIFDTKAELTDIPDKLPADGGNADTVNGHTVNANVPADAVFTDTTYKTVSQTEDGLMSSADKEKLDGVAEELNDHIADQVKHITPEERAAWSAVNYSNPNLLINPDFRINQRGKTTYGYDENMFRYYCVDRWLRTNTLNVDVNNDCLSLSGDGWLHYYPENPEQYTGDYVFSAKITSLSSGSIRLAAADSADSLSNYTFQDFEFASGESKVIVLPMSLVNGLKTILISPGAKMQCKLYWAKLEHGSIATPFTTPDPATELAKCQRYYQRLQGNTRYIGSGFILASKTASICAPISTPMRVQPTVTIHGTAYIWTKDHVGGGAYTSTEFASGASIASATISLPMIIDATNDVVGYGAILQFRDSDSYIELSAEL